MATVDELLQDATRRMDGSVEHTRTEFNTVRTAVANRLFLVGLKPAIAFWFSILTQWVLSV